jgi:hypothetical protein
MSTLRPLFATVGNIIDLAVTCFLMFKGFVWGGIGGMLIPIMLTGSKEITAAVIIFGIIGALIGTFIGLLLSGLVSAALAPLYWAPPPPPQAPPTYVPPPEHLPRARRRRSASNPLQPHRHE